MPRPIFDGPAEPVEPPVNAGSARRFSSMTATPGVVVTLENLRADPGLTVGSTVSAGKSKIGRVIDLSQVERAGLARYTQDKGQHVHLEVHPAAALTSS